MANYRYTCNDDDYALSYLIAEAEETARQVKLWTLYNSGIPALPDHKWVIRGTKIEEVPDYSNLTKDHYCFRLYKYEHCNKETWNDDQGFEVWKNYLLDPSCNNFFKLIYTWDIRDLIPDGFKLDKKEEK